MSLIKIKGRREFIELSYAEAFKINSCWIGINGEEKRDNDDKFIVGGISLTYFSIEYVDLSDKPRPQNTEPEIDDNALNKFIADMIEYSKKPLQHIVGWYGKDEQEEKKFPNGNVREYKKNRVYNPLIGLTDARVVQYCLDRNIISNRSVPENNRCIGWAVFEGKDYDNFITMYNKMMYKKAKQKEMDEKDLAVEAIVNKGLV